MKNRNAICILTARPKPGRNDLEWHLGKKQSALLSRAFLLDTIAAALHVTRCNIYLAYCTDDEPGGFNDIIYLFKNEENDHSLIRKADDILPLAQEGLDTGQRISNISYALFKKGIARVLIVCPDSPIIDPVILKASIELLKSYNVVLGPTFDGAYYLVGVGNHYPQLFEAVDWAKENVYKQTIDNITKLNLKWQELEISYDVDRLEALEQLYCDIDNLRLTGKNDICRHTEKCLANLKR
jgi:glycosyltransferase A (GT-A) superfamily protein (DUF2064 family)